MRLLVVSQHFWPEGFRINDVTRSLVERGVEVDVLAGKPNYPEGRIFPGYRAWGLQRESWSGLTIFRVPNFPRGKGGAWRLAFNYLSFIVSGALLGPWILRGRKYEVTFVCGMSPILQAIPAILISRLKGVKVALWVQDLWPESLAATGYVRNPVMLKVVEQAVRWVYCHSDLILVQSSAFEAPVAALAPGKPIVYYPNSVDAMFSDPPAPGVELPEVEALNEGFSVVFAGNVGAAQAVDVIVEAAELLKPYPEIRVVVFGKGSRWVWMGEQAQERGLTNLHLPGRFPVETMPGLMQKANALLVTLTDAPIFAFTIPTKVQAYLAAGRPILACLNGVGARLVERAGAGLSVPAEDSRGLADAILRLYRMTPEERSEMGENGRRHFKANFDHEDLMDDLMEHFTEMSVREGASA
ncbi:MAG: glycosyltransferase family 4 protein [Longimicrobiales bacterium]